MPSLERSYLLRIPRRTISRIQNVSRVLPRVSVRERVSSRANGTEGDEHVLVEFRGPKDDVSLVHALIDRPSTNY